MVRIVGHRGGRNLWPENSLAGFREVSKLGIDGVEFDVHQSRDGELFVMHDPTLDRTARGSGPLADRTADELSAIQLRHAPLERIPRLEAVLDILEPSDLELHIEIKTDAFGRPYPGIEQKLVDIIKRRGLERRSILTCFAPEVLENVRRIWPESRILASFDRRSAEMLGGIQPGLDRFLALPGCLISVEISLLKLAMPLCLDRIGADRLAAWVPNKPDDLTYWLSQPLRAVTTDRPDLALKARQAGG